MNKFGAEEGTRTPTELPAAPLKQCVYQFHHLGMRGCAHTQPEFMNTCENVPQNTTTDNFFTKVLTHYPNMACHIDPIACAIA